MPRGRPKLQRPMTPVEDRELESMMDAVKEGDDMPAVSAAPPKPEPKSKISYCSFCDAPARPTRDGIHRCQCRRELTGDGKKIVEERKAKAREAEAERKMARQKP